MEIVQNRINQIQNLFHEKKFDEIEKLSNYLLIKYHDSFEIYFIIGTSFLAKNRLLDGLDLLLKANKLNPSSSICLLNIGICYKKLKKIDQYKKFIELAHFIDPNNIEIIYELGLFYMLVNEIKTSLIYFEKISKYKKSDLNFVLNICNAYLRFRKSKKVINICLQFIENNNPNYFLLNTLAVAYKTIDDFFKAKLYLYESVKLNPKYFQGHRNLSTLINYKAEHKHFVQMRLLYDNANNTDNMDIDLNLALSKAYKDIKNYKKSFFHLQIANSSIKNLINYDGKEESNKFARIKLIFNIKNSIYKFEDSINIKPIFILGLPRSGTTLIENIISSHSKVYDAGELDSLQNWGEQYLYNNPNNHSIDSELILKCRKNYLNNIPETNKKTLYITDKMPLNFLWIGLIFSCFPNAKIIHVKRDPIATCWSLFNTYFSSNGNAFSYNQDDIYTYYNLYMDLMSHWEKLYSQKIYHLNYENLVLKPKKEIQLLLDHCLLNHEDGCFNPHLNNREVHTASAIQVRKKIYKGSKNSWRHFEKYISHNILSLER